MRRSLGLWLLALLITAASAFWQRISGPTYPVSGTVTLGGQEIRLRLSRTHGGAGDQPVEVAVSDPAITGSVAWRRFPTAEPWQLLPLEREGSKLAAALPHQPPAGKLEYQLRLVRGGETAFFPLRPVVTRFKGEVPALLLVPHIVLIFAAMLFSTRAGLAAISQPTRVSLVRLAGATLSCLVLGGLLLGPLVQKAAFDAFWTGWPFGQDLTDNKTAVSAVAWAITAWRLRGGRSARRAILVAAAITLLVFAIPHSTWGSEIDWSDPQNSCPQSLT